MYTTKIHSLPSAIWRHEEPVTQKCRWKFLSCPVPSHSVPNKHTEDYINSKLFGLLIRLVTNKHLQIKLTHNSSLCLTMWLATFSE